MAALFDNSNPYGASSYGVANAGYGADQANLQFYSAGSSSQQVNDYSRPSLEGNVGSGGLAANGSYERGQIQGKRLPKYQVLARLLNVPVGGFWSAFTASGYPDEPPLLEGERTPQGSPARCQAN